MKFSLNANSLCTIFLIIITLSLEISKCQQPSWTVINTLRRPKLYYTQGLIFSSDGNYLYESSGLYGTSQLVKMSYPSLSITRALNLNSKYFAEGIAVCGNYLYMLTYRERTILKFTYPTLTFTSLLNMDSNLREGWGLSNYKSNYLIASDGTSNIYVLACTSLKAVSKISVTIGGRPLNKINSLAYALGYIWANVYYDNRIFKIDPNSGYVITTYDLTSLVNYELNQGILTSSGFYSGNVLNGIAYNPVGKYFLITGKKWGNYYQIVFN